MPFEEAHGGVGGGAVETMIVMESFGRVLALEPYLASVVLGGGLVRLGGSAPCNRRCCRRIASGETLVAFAHAERQSRYDLADVAMSGAQGWIARHSRRREDPGARTATARTN